MTSDAGDVTREDVNLHLRASWTDEGVRLWWERARPWLPDGRTPNQAWLDGDRQEVYDLAVEGRGMVAT